MEIKIKDKPSKRTIRFSDLSVSDLFEYGAYLYIKTESFYEEYDDEDSIGNAIKTPIKAPKIKYAFFSAEM
jgi:hypothetical protein